MASPGQRVIRQLSGLLDRRRELEQDIHPVRVEGRREDGTLRVVRLDQECEQHGDGRPAQAGQILHFPAGSPFSSRGATGVGPVAQDAISRILWVEALDPSTLELGSTTTVTVTGRGFRETTEFEFLLPGSEEPHPGISISAQTLISSEEVELEVVVAADATLVANAPLAYDNPGSPL